jgi:hypothetical protein
LTPRRDCLPGGLRPRAGHDRGDRRCAAARGPARRTRDKAALCTGLLKYMCFAEDLVAGDGHGCAFVSAWDGLEKEVRDISGVDRASSPSRASDGKPTCAQNNAGEGRRWPGRGCEPAAAPTATEPFSRPSSERESRSFRTPLPRGPAGEPGRSGIPCRGWLRPACLPSPSRWSPGSA